VLKIATSSPFFLITRTELHFYAVYIILSFFVFGTLSALEKRSILPMFRVEMVKKGGGLVFGIDKQYPKPFFLSLVRTQVLKTETLLVYLKGTPKKV